MPFGRVAAGEAYGQPTGVFDFERAHIEVPAADIGYGLWRGGPPFVTWVALGPGARALTVKFADAAPGHGPCTARYTVRIAVSAWAVARYVPPSAIPARSPPGSPRRWEPASSSTPSAGPPSVTATTPVG